MGVQGGVAGKRYYQGYSLKALEDIPLLLSIAGCFVTFIHLIFSFSVASLSFPFLDNTFGITFYLDTLNAFCLFCLFICGALFIFFKRELGSSHYFLLPYVNSLILLLAGNLYFIAGILSLLMMMTYGLSVGKSLSPFIGLAGLLIAIALFPGQLNEQGNFVYLSFEMLRKSTFSPYILFFILLTSSVLIGCVPFGQWRMNIARQGKGDIVYSSMNLFLSMAGIYLLLRFYVDLGRNSETLLLSFFVQIIGVIAACYAGWQSLVVKTFSERISCLFILGNGILVQTIGIITSCTQGGHQQWISFANDIFYFGLFIEFISFTFIFLLSSFLKSNQENQSTFFMPSHILISLLLFSFLLSGMPPFAGFSVLWGNLQLLLAMPSGHHLINTLITTVIIGLNAIVLIVSLLGWLRLVLIGGVQSLQNAVYELPHYFSLKLYAEIKIGIIFLFSTALVPGCIFLLARSVTTDIFGLPDNAYNFFTFRTVEQHILFTPWIIACLFIGLVMMIGWVAKKEKKKGFILSLRDSNTEPKKHRSVIVEETSFSFGQGSFQAMLERRFSFIYSLVSVNYVLCKYWMRFKKICLKQTHQINLFIWQYQNLFLLLAIVFVLISTSFIAR